MFYYYKGYIKPYQRLEITDEMLANPVELYVKLDKLMTSYIANEKTKRNSASKKRVEAEDKEDKFILFKVKDYANYRDSIIDLLDIVSKYKLPYNNLHFYSIYDEENMFNEEAIFNENNLNALSRINNKILQENMSDGLRFPNEATNVHIENSYNYKILNSYWRFDAVLNSNLLLNNVANEIKKSNLTQFEQYLAAYSWVNSYVYEEETKKEYYGKSRKTVEVLSSNRIVCVGYANLLNQICQRLNIPTTTQSIWYNDNTSSFAGHARNIVKIKDDEYGIDSTFVSDPTWDSKINKDYFGKSYFYSNIPLPLRFDSSIVHENEKEGVLFDMVKYKGSELSEKIRSHIYNKGIEYYKKYENFLDKPLVNYNEVLSKYKNEYTVNGDFNLKFGIELNKAVEHNVEQITKLHENINNSKSVDLTSFQVALYNVFDKVNLNYFDLPTIKENNFSQIVEKITEFNYKLAQKRIKNYPHLKNKLTFTQDADFKTYMIENEMDKDIKVGPRL